MSEHLLEATGLRKSFPTRRNLLGRTVSWTHSVRGVDLQLERGKTLAVVGESGAGKSTLGRLILRLIEPDAGSVLLDGTDVLTLGRAPLRKVRKRMQMVFQDPFSSLDPHMIIEDAVAEPLIIHFDLTGPERTRRVHDLLDRIGITAAQAERYPHEFSGGQLQRIAIARALTLEPDLIVCDEPVAALDVSVQAQVMNLLYDLQEERGVAYLFISHDLSLVRLIADRIAVMYQGEIVEEAEPEQLYEHPRHPYTKALLAAIPVPDPRRRDRSPVVSEPEALDIEQRDIGCSFAPRCPLATDRCWSEQPALRRIGDGRLVSCHLVEAPDEATAAQPVDEPVVQRPRPRTPLL